MKKTLSLLLLLPSLLFSQIKVKDLPSITNGKPGWCLILDTLGTGGTRKITASNFISTYSLTTNGVKTLVGAGTVTVTGSAPSYTIAGGGIGSGVAQRVGVWDSPTQIGSYAPFTFDTTTHKVQIGTGTPVFTSTKGLVIINDKGIAGLGTSLLIADTTKTNQQIISIYEDLTYFTRYSFSNSNVNGNFPGTSIPNKKSTSIRAGVQDTLPILFKGNPIYGTPGRVSTNMGFRQDLTGFRIDQIGNLHTPNAYALDVEGTLKIADGTQSNGRVLTSNASGVATWQAPATSTISIAGIGTTTVTGGPTSFTVASSSQNFANANLVFDDQRLHDLNGFGLQIAGGGFAEIIPLDLLILGHASSQIMLGFQNSVDLSIGREATGPISIGQNSSSNITIGGSSTSTEFFGDLKYVSSGSDGDVLTRDASGIATWQPSSAGSGTVTITGIGTTTVTGGPTSFTVASASENFANTDLTLTGNRIHELDGNDLTIQGSGSVNINPTGAINIGVSATGTPIIIGDNTDADISIGKLSTGDFVTLGENSSATTIIGGDDIRIGENNSDSINIFGVKVEVGQLYDGAGTSDTVNVYGFNINIGSGIDPTARIKIEADTTEIISAIKYDGGGNDGDVLTRDADGNATWQPASAGSFSLTGIGTTTVTGGPISFTVATPSILAASNGGTGIGTYTIGDLLQATGASTLSRLPSVSAGSYLRSVGTSSASVWSTLKLPNSATSGRIIYATGTDTWGDNAALTYGTVSGANIGGSSSGTSMSNAIGLSINNVNSTTNNWAGMGFADATGGSYSAGVSCQFIDRTNHYGHLTFATRAADGYLERARILSTGGLLVGTTSFSNAGGLFEVQGTASSTVHSILRNLSTNSNAFTQYTVYNSSTANAGGYGITNTTASGGGVFGTASSVYLVSNTAAGLNLAATNAAGSIRFFAGAGAAVNERWRIATDGNLSNTGSDGTAYFHLKAGTATSNTAPIKFTSGTNLTTPEVGAMEYSSNYFLTKTGARFGLGGTLFTDFADVSNSGTGETDLYTHTITANTMDVNGSSITVEAVVDLVTTGTTTAVRLYYAGTAFIAVDFLLLPATEYIFKAKIVRDASTTAKIFYQIIGNDDVVSTGYSSVSATHSSANVLKLTGEHGSGSSNITAKLMTVEYKSPN